MLASPTAPADNPIAARPPVPRRPAPENDAPLLTDPLPQVSTILVSAERRIAMVDGGRIVGVGDTIGQRVVAAIEPRALVLREPSGVQIRVGLGGRLLGVDRRSR